MTAPQLSRCPAHDALELVEQLLRLLSSHPMAQQYLKGIPELVELERQMRLAVAPRSNRTRADATHANEFCVRCLAFHAPMEVPL